MESPSASDVRGWSEVVFSDIGDGRYEDDVKLQLIVDRANAYVQSVTGRVFDDAYPALFVPLAQECVTYVTEDMIYQRQQDMAEAMQDYAEISSFSAGSYSETRRGLSDNARKNGMVDPDPRVDKLLWQLMTDDKRDEWSSWLGGTNTPAFSVTEVDWGAQEEWGGLHPPLEPRSRNF